MEELSESDEDIGEYWDEDYGEEGKIQDEDKIDEEKAEAKKPKVDVPAKITDYVIKKAKIKRPNKAIVNSCLTEIYPKGHKVLQGKEFPSEKILLRIAKVYADKETELFGKASKEERDKMIDVVNLRKVLK